MNIHTEKEIVNVKDSQLFTKMLSYAKPYWKMILFCIVLAFFIVVAELARPYLIQIAIDDHINGINKPMLAVEQSKRELLEEFGDALVVGDYAYVRVKQEMDVSDLSGEIVQKQVVQVQRERYLIDGWLTSGQEDMSLRMEAGTPTIDVLGQSYRAVLLDGDMIQDFRSKDLSGFLLLGAFFLIAVVGSALLNYLQSVLLQFTGQEIIFNIRQQLFQHLSRMSMSFFDRNPVGRLVVRVTQDTESLNQLYSQVVVNLVKDLIILIGIVTIMLFLSVKLALLAFAVIPILAVLTFWYKTVVRAAQRKARIILSTLNAFLAENLSGIRITQLFIREQRQWELFEQVNQDYYKAGMRGTIINSIFQPAIGFFGNFAVALLIWYGGASVIEGSITFGIVYAFTHYVRQFFNPLMSLAEKYNQIQTAMVGAERIFEMLDEQPSIVDSPNPRKLPVDVKGIIEFKNVWFAYQGEEWVLKDVSFRIEHGETVAFVGATGAGKSSVIQLINRFYDVQKGSITLDGIDVRDLPLQELRRHIGIVQQDVFLFTGDIASNIRLNNKNISDEQVVEAAGMVHMDEYIKRLPMQYQTPLGERGVSLSQGQRQLLSFARAIVFRPPILILDEATSSIDTETELIVQDALRTISAGRTTVIVAHRLSTIQHSDQIIVMHKGKIREIGNHNQLLAKKGYYYRLFELQYKDEENIQMADSR